MADTTQFRRKPSGLGCKSVKWNRVFRSLVVYFILDNQDRQLDVLLYFLNFYTLNVEAKCLELLIQLMHKLEI